MSLQINGVGRLRIEPLCPARPKPLIFRDTPASGVIFIGLRPKPDKTTIPESWIPQIVKTPLPFLIISDG